MVHLRAYEMHCLNIETQNATLIRTRFCKTETHTAFLQCKRLLTPGPRDRANELGPKGGAAVAGALRALTGLQKLNLG